MDNDLLWLDKRNGKAMLAAIYIWVVACPLDMNRITVSKKAQNYQTKMLVKTFQKAINFQIPEKLKLCGRMEVQYQTFMCTALFEQKFT